MKLGDAINKLDLVELNLEHAIKALQILPEEFFNDRLREATSLIQERTRLSEAILEGEKLTLLDGRTSVHEARLVIEVLKSKEKIFMTLLMRRDLKKQTSDLVYKELTEVRDSLIKIESAIQDCVKRTDLELPGDIPGN